MAMPTLVSKVDLAHQAAFSVRFCYSTVTITTPRIAGLYGFLLGNEGSRYLFDALDRIS